MFERRIAYFDRMSDRKLVELLLANDAEAVEYVFYYRCEAMFARICSEMYSSKVRKDELIGEFYLHLSADQWRRLRQFGFRSSFDTWLTVVALHFFKEKKALFQTNNPESAPLLIEMTDVLEDDFDIFHEMSKKELYEAISGLPKTRERLALIGELIGKNAETIAKELGCTISAVYNLTKRAKKAVKKMLKGKER